MIISHHHQFIFFHNPKTAGTSLHTILERYHDDEIPANGIFRRPPFDDPLDFAHLRLWEISLACPAVIAAAQTYRSLIFVRDPYRRFLSAVDQHFKTYCPDLPLATMQPEEQLLLIETFVEKILRLEMARTDYRFVHFSPQVWFLQNNGLRLARHILPMDDQGMFITRGLEILGLPSQAVAHDNKSRIDLTHILVSRKIRAFVNTFYVEDFAFLAADPALAHLAVVLTDAMRQGAAVGISGTGCRECWSRENTAPHGGETRNDAISAADTIQDESGKVQADLKSALTWCAPRSTDPHPFRDGAGLAAISQQIDSVIVDLAAGRIREAFDRVKAILEEYPDFPRAVGLLGQIAVVAGHPAAGLASLQRAVALDPRLEHRVWLALCLAKLGCHEDAVNV